MWWDPVVNTARDLAGKCLHTLSSEWRQKRYHFVEDTAQAPNVARMIVRLILPDFWARVVRRASLCREQALLGDLGHVQVPELENARLCQEQICAFDVSVDNF